MTSDVPGAAPTRRGGHEEGDHTIKPEQPCDETVIRMMQNGILAKHPDNEWHLTSAFAELLRSNLAKYAPGAAAYLTVTAYCDGLSLDDRAEMFAGMLCVIRQAMPGLADRITRDMEDTLGRGGQ